MERSEHAERGKEWYEGTPEGQTLLDEVGVESNLILKRVLKK